jgi:hypothetical protein
MVIVKTTVLRWATVLGIVGFVCGFFGPIVLAPGANQGPMIGIFITGPGGALLGAILGWVVGLLKVPDPIASRALYVVAMIVAVVALYFCIPPPRFRADIVDGEIRRCILPESLRGKTLERLNEITAAQPPLSKPIHWGEAFDQALTKNAGVVIEVHVFRRSKLYETQALWNQGTLMVEPWVSEEEEKRYFASYLGKDCASYTNGVRSLLVATGPVSIWPPTYIAEMLDLKVAGPLPAEVASLVDVTAPQGRH